MSRSAVGSYASSALLAVFAAGLLYVGLVLLTDVRRPEPPPLVEGAIRLAQPEPDSRPEETPDRLPPEPEPPAEQPRAFAAPGAAAPRPELDLHLPAFDVASHPALSGGLALPEASGLGAGFRLDEVDEVPRPVASVPPKYPYNARRERIEGRVVVRMLVTASGEPASLSVASAEPEGVFEEAALEAARRWRFRPGRYSGQDVDTWVLLPFDFKLVD
ncbi:MAG: energy transducer TonB [Desulfovibrionaceae bacterium]